MPPVVALGDPEDVAAVHVVAVEVVVIDEGIGLLLGYVAAGAVSGVHSHELIELVAALVVLKCEILGVSAPLAEAQIVLVGVGSRVDGHLLSGSQVEESWCGLGQAVTGLGVVQPAELGLNLVLGSGLAEGYLPLLDVLSLDGSHLLRVRGPIEFGIVVLLRAVKAQLTLVAAGRGSGGRVGGLRR